MKEYVAKEAIKQYNEIKTIFDKNKDKTLKELYEIYHNNSKFCINNYREDGFDVETDRIIATVLKYEDGDICLCNTFDMDASPNLNGDWMWTTVENLQKVYGKQ